MEHDPKTVRQGINLMFVARNLERLADHATNIAEDVLFLVEGVTSSPCRNRGVIPPSPELRASPRHRFPPEHVTGTSVDTKLGYCHSRATSGD